MRLTIFFIAVSLTTFAQNYYQSSWKDFSKSSAANQIINAYSPDYQLLNAAIFHATNEMREQHRLPVFQYSEPLFKASDSHAQTIMKSGKLSHFGTNGSKPHERIMVFSKDFMGYAENLAQYPLLDSPNSFCLEKNSKGDFVYFDCKTKKPYQIYTYWSYARLAVAGWMGSEGHRRNILDREMQFLACAVKVSANPFKSQNPPYAMLVQNFGGK
jgi:uncharacterized protein YkwD